MTKDSLFRMLVPERLRRLATGYVKEGRVHPSGRPASCRGMKRAAWRRLSRAYQPWVAANAVALPHRQRKQKRNLELLQLAAELHAQRMVVIRSIFGKRKVVA